jgi:hypothetical protein
LRSFRSDSTPPNELTVVGENKEDPSELLLLGADGNYYAYSLPADDIHPVEPDDHWNIEPISLLDPLT